MPIPTVRLVAIFVSLQVSTMLGFACAATPPRVSPVPSEQADRIVVTKSTHTLVLYSHGAVLRTYKVALGRGSGRKEQQGDHRTPEGHYFIDSHNPHTLRITSHSISPTPTPTTAPRLSSPTTPLAETS